MERGCGERFMNCRDLAVINNHTEEDLIFKNNSIAFFKLKYLLLKHFSFFQNFKVYKLPEMGPFPSPLTMEVTLKYIKNRLLIMESPCIRRLCGLNLQCCHIIYKSWTSLILLLVSVLIHNSVLIFAFAVIN